MLLGFEFTLRQWGLFLVIAAFVIPCYTLPDIYIIARHIGPITTALRTLDRGERPTSADASRAIVRALNLPFFSFLRVTLFHGPGRRHLRRARPLPGQPRDRLRVQGKREPVAIYEAMDHLTEESFPNLSPAVERYTEGIRLYRAGEFKDALECFKDALTLHPGDKPSRLYVERSEHFIATPPPGDWDGVWTMTSSNRALKGGSGPGGGSATTRPGAASDRPWLGSIGLGGARLRVTGTGPRAPTRPRPALQRPLVCGDLGLAESAHCPAIWTRGAPPVSGA